MITKKEKSEVATIKKTIELLKEFGDRCLEFSLGCGICQAYIGVEILENLLMGYDE